MIRVAVVGANGQVGTEVCLLLSCIAGVQPIPIVRFAPSTALLRRLGLECRIGSVADKAMARGLLTGADLVVDFSLPSGLPSDARANTEAIISSIQGCAPTHAPYVYCSSTMAYGMAADSPRYQASLLPRTLYARQKRFGERLAMKYGERTGRPTWAFRLGQVHGEFQTVSRQLRLFPFERELLLPDDGEALSDIVFPLTIVRGLLSLHTQALRPGIYTIVETPAWTQRDVFDLYAAQAGHRLQVRTGDTRLHRLPMGTLLWRRLESTLLALAQTHRELLLAHLPSSSALEFAFKTRNLLRRARIEADAMVAKEPWEPRWPVGPVPGRRLNLGPGEHPVYGETARRARRLIDSHLGAEAHVFRDQ